MNGADLVRRGLTMRHVTYWVDKGYIRPTDATPGSGRPLEFTDDEARIAVVMLTLVNAGIVAAVAARLARDPVTGAAELHRLMNVVLDGGRT